MLILVDNEKIRPMKTAELLLNWMDELQRFMSYINNWIEKGSELFQKAKMLVQKAIDWIEQIIDTLVQSVGGRKTHTSQLLSEDYLFV